ncbi:adenylate kinase [Rhizophlyctis rosea]|uniref:Adenylate kinase n=1 Tax=Rhizophlyctis rosea TaxID=64517 RepID=A0AAD5SD00_9FUNG|nr:adenylate kinase [Rhizophlyctis rosea]
MLDPVTGQTYPSAQVLFSKRRIAEIKAGLGGEDDNGSDEDEEEEAAEEEEDKSDEGSDAGSEDGEHEEKDEEDEDEKKRKKKGKGNEKSGPTWTIIQQDILDRLIKRPEDTLISVQSQLRAYAHHSAALDALCDKHFDVLHRIELDATQHPDALFDDAMERIDSLGYSMHFKAVAPKGLQVPEGGFRGLQEPDIIKQLSSTQLEDGEPRREISMWGRYCPVTFTDDGTLVQASTFNFPASYRGSLYFLQSETHLARFLANPDKFLARPPKVSNLRLCILGGPFSGKSTQAKLVARIYNLLYVSVDEILRDWDSHPDQAKLMKEVPLYGKIARKLRSGKTLPADMQVSIIKTTLVEAEAKGLKYDGWVLDGFPRTVDQVQALTANEIIPQYVVVLNNDINDESVRTRHELFKTSIRTGRPTTAVSSAPPVTRPAETADFEIQAFPFFDNLYNGFREEYNEVIKTLEEAEASVVTVQAELEVPTVLSMVQGAIDPFLPKATLLTPKHLAELPPDIELGYTKDYCPYTLRESNVLQKGNPQLAVKYEGRYYYFSSEEARTAFVLEPHNYVTSRVPMVPPPPRIAILGAPGSGRATCLKALSSYNVPIVNFEDYIKHFAAKQEPGLREEIEYTIRENAGMLSPPVLFEILQSLFVTEPYCKTGFLLSHFPRNKLEAETLLKHNFHLDAFVILNLTPEVAIHRLLATRRKQAETELLARAAEGGDPAIVRKVQDAIRKGAGGDDDEEDAGDEDDEEAAEWKLRSDEDMKEEIVDTTEKETSLIGDVTATLDGLSSIPVINIDANKYARVVISNVKRKLKPYLDDRKSLFAPTKGLKRKAAEKLLEYGVKTYSPFGRYDPVALHNGQPSSSKTVGNIPVTFKDFIYFCLNKANSQDLVQNALTFTSQPAQQPNTLIPVPLQVIILGSPKSGKTTLAQKIAEETGAVFLSVAVIVEMLRGEGGRVGVEEGGVGIGEKIMEVLHRGGTIPVDLVTEGIRVVTSRAGCQSKGWVLDGYPLTIQQTQALEKAGIYPQIVINLTISNDETVRRTEQDRQADVSTTPPTPHLNFNITADLRSASLQPHLQQIQDLYTTAYANWATVDGTSSKWAIKEKVVRMLEDGVKKRRAYLDLKSRGLAAPIHKTSLPLLHITLQTGKFKTYCPVCLIDSSHLVQSSLTTEFMAEYKGRYYSAHSTEHLETFLKEPEKYVNGRDLPAGLPSRIAKEGVKAMFPKGLEIGGYCPVTFVEGGGRFESIVPGDENFVAEYEGKLYAMASEEKVETFMRTPDPYTNIRLPTKLPPKHAPLNIATLPLTGYLEQTVADALIAGLNAVGKAKPKYPYRSVAESACQYLGLWLKANNPNSKPYTRATFAKKLKQFTDRCDLIGSLSEGFARSGGAYVEKDVMGAEFEKKVGELLRLAPTTSSNGSSVSLAAVELGRGRSVGSLSKMNPLPAVGSQRVS